MVIDTRNECNDWSLTGWVWSILGKGNKIGVTVVWCMGYYCGSSKHWEDSKNVQLRETILW